MTTNAQNNSTEELSDELNPAFLFSTTHRDLLLQIAKGEIDPVLRARQELANRGLSQTTGLWVGPDRANRELNDETCCRQRKQPYADRGGHYANHTCRTCAGVKETR